MSNLLIAARCVYESSGSDEAPRRNRGTELSLVLAWLVTFDDELPAGCPDHLELEMIKIPTCAESALYRVHSIFYRKTSTRYASPHQRYLQCWLSIEVYNVAQTSDFDVAAYSGICLRTHEIIFS